MSASDVGLRPLYVPLSLAHLFVAPMTTTRSKPEATPSNWTRNSVFSRRLASCSPELRSDRMLSISSALRTHARVKGGSPGRQRCISAAQSLSLDAEQLC